jgi:endonuclease/exonuclease/phosphatase family metal-dependent hydrolase
MALSIVSWNIQKGIGMDLRRDVARTADVLAALEPDVVGLQEVLRVRGMDQAASIAERLGMTLSWGEARKTRDGSYGNALLVRGDVLRAEVVDLTVGRREARCCLDARVRVQGTEVRVLVCHLGLGLGERRQQTRRLTEVLRQLPLDAPRVVMGDFNEWHRGPVWRALLDEFPAAPGPRRSHPSAMPLFALDRLVWDDSLEGTLEVLPVRMASDHRLLRARLAPRAVPPT